MLRLCAIFGLIAAANSAVADIIPTLNPQSLDFGSVQVGTTSSLTADVGIFDDGNGNQQGDANNGILTAVSIINQVGGVLSASQNCVGFDFSAQNPTATCPIQVDCTPGAAGPISGDLEVQLDLDNMAGIHTASIPVTCNGVNNATAAIPVPALGMLGLGGLSLLLAGGGLLAARRRRDK